MTTKTGIALIDEFTEAVSSGALPSGEPVRLAVDRFLRDLDDKESAYYFDVDETERILKITRLFKHTKGGYAGKTFNIQPFQAFILGNVYGWKEKETGRRKHRKFYIEIARKNGKTELAAIIAIIALLFDGEAGPEVYTAATKRDQARICWDAAKIMLKRALLDYDELSQLVQLYRFNIVAPKSHGKLEALAADSSKLDGLNPSCAIIDEYGAHRTSELVEVIETGQGARENPILFIITTAYYNTAGPAYHLRKVCIDVLKGIKDDPRLFSMIFTLDDADSWEDPEQWVKANPNLGVTPRLEWMQDQFLKARNEGASKEVNFKTKNLNLWTTTSATWISDADLMASGQRFDAELLRGRSCYAGLDLSSVRDITALALFFPPEGGEDRFLTKFYFFIPEDTARQRAKESGANIEQWVKDGWIITTPGNSIDFDFIKAVIMEVITAYQVKVMGYDPWGSARIIQELITAGLKVDPVQQGYKGLSQAYKELERLILAGQLFWNDNPVFRWMLSNVDLKIDPAGNIKADKAKSADKIDGVTALATAIAQYNIDRTEAPSAPNVYIL